MTTKKEYVQHILDVLKNKFIPLGFTAKEQNRVFERHQSDEVLACITVQTVTSKLPKSVVALDFYASIRLHTIAEVCARLFDRGREVATIGGALGKFTKRDNALSTYRFDWNQETESQFQRLETDLTNFSKFAEGVHSYADLDRRQLIRIPWLRRNFADGLGETYKYTVPEVAAVLHRLNGEVEQAARALAIAEQNTSQRLTEAHLDALRSYIAGEENERSY